MALVLVVFFKVLFLLAAEGSLINESISSDISLGSSLTTDTNSSWLSPSGLFAFGFYQQDEGFAVGIWLTTKPEITVVWTANRDDPPLSSNSTINLTRDGRLILLTTYGEQKSITDQLDLGSATSASMFDSGNFVLYNHFKVIWQSFDYPCDTILGGQELAAGDRLVSSVLDSQHSSGRFVLNMQEDGNLVAYPQNGARLDSDAYWATGTSGQYYDFLILNHNGSLHLRGRFGGAHMVSNPSTSSWSRKNETIVFRATLSPQGNFVLYSHRFTNPSSNSTEMVDWEALQDPCKAKGICGVNSYCYTTAGKAECRCFPGFLFFNDSTNGMFLGCYRNFTDEEACGRRGVQLSYNITSLDNMEVGVYPYSVMSLSKEACINSCLDDCNCWVGLFANGSCKMLKVPIIYAVLNKSILATIFIKTSFPKVEDRRQPLPALKIPEQSAVAERKKLVSILAITLGLFALMCTLMAFSSFFYYRVHARRYQRMSENVDSGLVSDHFTLRSFSFEELHKATDGFKEVIGRNSIGEVYKGFISEGKKSVAVKRLHTRMLEGDGRFRAEITAIAQTHHRNLVRLLGFCIHGATKLLVYEFMSNGSLADLLFNPETRPGWKKCVSLALDVARGILYLHQECETRIIHCNIKPHNILFDESWTAKISDFGLSKLLRPDQSGTLTFVRGTRGYLAPEWHKNTLISTKVDIYSFGVVLLEILCCTGGMEIDSSCDDKISLFTWVYDCFVAKELKRLIGDEEVDIYVLEKMVKVGLLCIQDDPETRPSIKHVILMLEGTTDIPIPPSPILPLI